MIAECLNLSIMFEKSVFLFMLILGGQDESSFSLQINVTKDITLIVQWVKDFPMMSFFCILLLLTAF